MRTDLIYPGEAESLKQAVHVAGLGFALICLGYNMLAWWYRRSPHLAANVAIYSALTCWECQQVAHHHRVT